MLSYRSLRPTEQVQPSVHNQHILGRHLSRTGVPHVTPLHLPDGLERYETDQIGAESYGFSGFDGPSDEGHISQGQVSKGQVSQGLVGNIGHVMQGPVGHVTKGSTAEEQAGLGLSFGSAAKEAADCLKEKGSCIMTVIAISLLFIIVLMLLIFGLLVGLLVTLSGKK